MSGVWNQSRATFCSNPRYPSEQILLPPHSPKEHIPICSIISWCGYITAVSHGQTGHLLRLEYKNTCRTSDSDNPACRQGLSTNSTMKITAKPRAPKSLPQNPASWTGSLWKQMKSSSKNNMKRDDGTMLSRSLKPLNQTFSLTHILR